MFLEEENTYQANVLLRYSVQHDVTGTRNMLSTD
jgi:hypothetical protein